MHQDPGPEGPDATLAWIKALREQPSVHIGEFRRALDLAGTLHCSEAQRRELYKHLRAAVRGDRSLRGLVDARLAQLDGRTHVDVRRAIRPPAAQHPGSWWAREEEQYWMEVTYDSKVGKSLAHDCYRSDGRRMQSWILASEIMSPGETVYHFRRGEDAITGRSRVTGQCVRHKTDPPRWQTPLGGYTDISPISVNDMRNCERSIREIQARLRSLSVRPYYLPFPDLSPLCLSQTYLVKLPREIVALFGFSGHRCGHGESMIV